MPPRPTTTTPKTRFAPKPTMKRSVKKPAAKKTAVAVRPTKKVALTTVTVTTPVKAIKRTYLFAVGRRKAAVARVRWHRQPGNDDITVNNRTLVHYFPTIELQQLIRDPFVITNQTGQGNVTVKVAGGGSQGQAEAVRLGIARILVKHEPDFRLTLKRAGYLRRDPRVKERKKYGLKRARRAPQWQKR